MKSEHRMILTTCDFRGQMWEMLFWLDAGDHAVELHVNNLQRPSLVGNIYIARVSKVMEQLRGMFLTAGELTFFCPLEGRPQFYYTHKGNHSDKPCQGDELVVQVVRDAIKSKEICVTSNLSFAAEHVLLTTENVKHGISKKIEGQKRRELRAFLQEYEGLPYGIVLRTNAQRADISELRREIDALVQEYQTFCRTAAHRQCGELLRQSPHPFCEHIHRLSHEACDEIVTDDNSWFDRLKSDDAIPCPIRKYEDADYPMEKLYGLHSMLNRALEPKVYLPHGGHILIEPTETLTAIDVNSGKNVSRKKAADYFWANNREAAEEIARQLRLRNISGMILVDFINMEDETQERELMSFMKRLTLSDYAKVDVIDYTKLGLMEITRAKKYPSLSQQLGGKPYV